MSDTRVSKALEGADSIAFDGCHKIYILLDAEQTANMREWGYEFVEQVTDRQQALERLREWWDESCELRFISSVRSPGENEDFMSIIGQCEDWQ